MSEPDTTRLAREMLELSKAYLVSREAVDVPGEAVKDILNIEEAAEFLGFSAYTTREKARSGEIPGRKVGREWRFSRATLLSFIEGKG